MRKSTLLCLFVLLGACKKPPPPQDKTAEFWTWFTANAKRYEGLNAENQAALLDEIGTKLEAVHPGLTSEFGLKPGNYELIISADGIRDRIPAVKQLVAAAPKIEGWTVIAFRPRKAEGFKIQMGDTELGMDNLWFTHGEKKKPIDLVIYVEGYTEKEKQKYIQVAFLMLDVALGEYDIMTKIGGLDFRAPPDPRPETLRPLEELPAVVDALPAL